MSLFCSFFGFFSSCQSSSVLWCPNFCTSSSPRWLNEEWDISAETCFPAFQGLCLFGFRYCGCCILGVFFLLSLSPHRLLVVIFVFIEDPFGVLLLLLLLSIVHQPINFAGLPHREAPTHPRPLRGAEPHLPVRPLLHLPEWRTTWKGDDTTKEGQRGRDAGEAR